MESNSFAEEFSVGYWELVVRTGESVLTSPALKKLLGYVESDFPNTPLAWKQLVSPADARQIISKYYLHSKGTRSTPFAFSVRCLHKDGGAREIHVTGRVVEWDAVHRPAKMLGCYSDLSPVKAKSQFLSVMSHEIRTPMNGMIGFINLLLQNPRPDQREYLDMLKFSAQSLLTFFNEFLELDKIESGRIELEQIGFDLRALLSNTFASMRLTALEKGLQFEFRADPAVPAMLTGDPVRIGQVVTNLLSNALKFTSAGKVSLTMTLKNLNADAASVHIAVSDTGIGIPHDKQLIIFEAFSQAGPDTTRLYGGTGLGLSIVKRLLELMGSSMQLESEPGKGSVFSFDLELKTVTDEVLVESA